MAESIKTENLKVGDRSVPDLAKVTKARKNAEQALFDADNPEDVAMAEEALRIATLREKNKIEIDECKNTIDEINEQKTKGTVSARYGYSTDHGKKADEEVQKLEDRIHELENFFKGETVVDDKEQKEGLTDAEKEEKIRDSKSFEELYEILKEIKGIQGTKIYYSSEKLVELIEKVRANKLILRHITKSLGLRDTVNVLLLDEEEKKAEKPGDKEEKENFENDPRYKMMLEEACIIWLKNDRHSRTYFHEQHLSFEISENGYILDVDGKETNYLPSQIDPAESKVKDKVKEEFLKKYPQLTKKDETEDKKDEPEKPEVKDPSEPPPLPLTPDGKIDYSRFEKRRKKIGAVKTDVREKRAQDITAERMTEEADSLTGPRLFRGENRTTKEQIKGFGNFFKRIWKHNWGAEITRSRETKKIKEELLGAGSNFAPDDVGGVKDRAIKEAVLKRFLADSPDLIHFDAGEQKDSFVSAEKKAQAETELRRAIERYASASDPAQAELDFKAERDRIYAGIFGEKDKSFNAVDIADNVFEFAREIRAQVEKGTALGDLDLDFELTFGEAKTGVRTEANYGWAEKMVQKIAASPCGRFFNETTIAAAVSAALIISRASTGKVSRALIGLTGMGVVAGGVSGLKESQAMERDRAEATRSKAAGRVFDSDKSPRRAELETAMHGMENAKAMTDNLHNMFYEKVGNMEHEKSLTPDDVKNILYQLSEIDSRISLSNKGKMDLISYSEEAMVEVERTNLDFERLDAKVKLKDYFAKNPNLGDFDTRLRTLTSSREDNLTNGSNGILERDAAFKKIKRKHVSKAVAKGVIIGLTMGLVSQEVVGAFSGKMQGVIGHFLNNRNGGSITSLEWAREKIVEAFGGGHAAHALSVNTFGAGHIPTGQGIETILPSKGNTEIGSFREMFSGNTIHVHDATNSFIKLPQGYELNPSGSHAGIYDVVHEGKTLVGGIGVDPESGELTAKSIAELNKAGFHVDSAVHNLKSEVISETGGTKAMDPQDFAHEHAEKFSKIKRLGWADNGTSQPDKNELKLWDPVERNGKYSFDIKMNHSGSMFNGEHIDPVKLASEGKLKALISMSHDTQGHPAEVPVNYANGKMSLDVDPKDPILGQFFHKAPNGDIVCDARYVEIGAEMGTKDGVKEFVMCATDEGKGLDTITTTTAPRIDDYFIKNVKISIEMPPPPTIPVAPIELPPDVVPPPIIPIIPRTPLESTKEKAEEKKKEPVEEPNKDNLPKGEKPKDGEPKGDEIPKPGDDKTPKLKKVPSKIDDIDLVRLSTEEEKIVPDIIKNELAYQNSELPDDLKKKTLDWANKNESPKKYAEALAVMLRKRSLKEIQDVANDMVKKCGRTLDKLGIKGTAYGKDKSWAMWDIGKQFYFLTHKNEADKGYFIGHPIDSPKKSAEIVDRHVGWEVYGAFKNMSPNEKQAFLDKFKEDKDNYDKVNALLNKPFKTNKTLSSLDLADLGSRLKKVK